MVQVAAPHLTPYQIKAALGYYEDHQEEIDADLRRHEEALGIRLYTDEDVDVGLAE